MDVVLIAGPTASGKSALALDLVRAGGGSIVNADSMQVYRDLRILTARPSPEEEGEVCHRLYGHVDGAVNYSVGRYLGPRIFRAEDNTGLLHRLLNRHHLDQAHAFFERHGGMAVVIARFVPIVRTFVPFVAGAGAMRYSAFALYNVAGALLWVAVCVGAGYAFGNVPIIKENFSFVALGIVAVSLIPMLVEWLKHRKKGQRS